jgi:diaminohydroxyphosphoribosylaminopyrimidine deaminase / 5-amino-6-(5-phosphoribosylamino)uracil reductase
MPAHNTYMHRCLQLASLGAGTTAPNPMVGAVLVHEGEIIGEGFTQPYGQAHAEVMCISSVPANKQALIPAATLYVSLEPCAHFGKTPPCTDLIIRHKIPQVIIGCTDPFEAVNGRGIEKLTAAGIQVTIGILEAECRLLNKRFFTFHTKKRPYIILKWAQSSNGKIAAKGEKTAISNELTNRLVHQWRSEEAATMVGANTAITDNPQLTTRLWPGKNPVRIVAAGNTVLPGNLHLFDDQAPTIIFNHTEEKETATASYYITQPGDNSIAQMLSKLHELNLYSVLVEGGAQLLQSFISSGLWDEARIITNTALVISNGVDAPVLHQQQTALQQTYGTDSINFFTNQLINQSTF